MSDRDYKLTIERGGVTYYQQPCAIGTKRQAQKEADKIRQRGHRVRVLKSRGRRGGSLIRKHGYNLWVAK